MMKRILLALTLFSLLLPSAVYAFPKDGVIDTFTRADSATLGNGWTEGSVTGWTIASNQCASNAEGFAYRNETYGRDMEVYSTIQAFATYFNMGFRYNIAGDNGYYVEWNKIGGGANDTIKLFKITAGPTYTQIGGTITQEWSAGYKLGASAIGSTLKVYNDVGSGWVEIISATDTTYSGASPNNQMTIYTDATGNTIDDFGGGTLSSYFLEFM